MTSPPKIDPRTETDLVIQTALFLQHFTQMGEGGWQPPGAEQVEPTVANLTGRILGQTLIDPATQQIVATSKIIATVGTVISAELAEQICKLPNLPLVAVWMLPETKAGNPKASVDAGWGLIRLFVRLMLMLRDRLNQVPQKNFLAFLNLIGTEIAPPQPARVPLTWYLAEGTTSDALVPAHTAIAAPAATGDAEEVVFETAQDLVVTTAQLKAVFVHQPKSAVAPHGVYSDRTATATGHLDIAYPCFLGDQVTERSLYLACDELLTQPSTKTLRLNFAGLAAAQLVAPYVAWFYKDGTDWKPLNASVIDIGQSKQIELSSLPPLVPFDLAGETAAWLRMQFLRPLASDSNSSGDAQSGNRLYINQITASSFQWTASIAPDRCYFNNTPLDLSRDFYPLGEQPRFNDTFYVASQEAFSKGNVQDVTIQIVLSSSQLPKDGKPVLRWEAWDGQTWAALNVTGQASELNLTQAGAVVLRIVIQLLTPIVPTIVNGESNYWVRARLISGNYGTPATINSTRKDSNGNPIYEVVPASFGPPSIQTLTLRYRSVTTRDAANNNRDAYISPSITITRYRILDRLTYTDPLANNTTALTQAAAKDNHILRVTATHGFRVSDRLTFGPANSSTSAPVYEIAAIDPLRSLLTLKTPLSQGYPLHTQITRSFQPIVPEENQHPTLYLGFDQAFANRSVSLYGQVEPLSPGAIANSQPPDQPAQLVWEYANPFGWVRLNVIDETENFSGSGLIRFIGPADFAARTEFGQSLYWLRCRWEAGDFRVMPQLRRWLTNTTWATQSTQFTETLGSSNGSPHQIFRTLRSPILLDERLEVQEGQMPPDPERYLLEERLGTDAIAMQTDSTGQIEAVWVRWQAVPDFYSSTERDRHYTLDRLTGAVKFGDGQRGKVPPQGTNNLRLRYTTGGGTTGNVNAETVTQLKTTIPAIDRVANLEAAGGGAEQESIERVQERGPKALRHRNRAITAQDIEDLALEASSDIARVKAITPQFEPLALQWQSIYPISLQQVGEIRAVLSGLITTGIPNPSLEMQINGPGQATPYAQIPDLTSDAGGLSYTVNPEDFQLSNQWWITLINHNPENVQGTLNVTFPGGSLANVSIEVPAANTKGIKNAGQVTLLIVPVSDARQPTPSLSLLGKVERYLCDRALPIFDLQVTEPVWVEVTVKVQLVPTAFDLADAVHTAAIDALTRFLHPLTGGFNGKGWAFGRGPFQSDIYRLLQSLEGVDHVVEQSLEIITIPALIPDEQSGIPSLLPEQMDRFLIYSGIHTVTIR